MLAEYIQSSYDHHTPFTYASHALHAVVYHRPDLKLYLFIARQCLRGWERIRHSVSHPPLTWEMTVVISCTLCQSGFHGPAVALLLGFDCYLRVSELTSLRKRDIVMPSDARMGQADKGMAVILPKTKTGPNQSVTVQNERVATILCHWMQSPSLRSAPLSALVFPFSPDWLRRLMHNACGSLGVSHIPYVPHSLRHGGATHDFLLTNSIEHVQFRGRWKSMESSRRYIQTARAMLAAQDVPPALNQLGSRLDADLVSVMTSTMDLIPESVPRARGRRVTFRL
jgi:integrase